MALLQRSLCFPPGDYPPAYPYVEPFVHADSPASDPFRLALYLVAGLFAANPHHAPTRLADCLGSLMSRCDGDNIEKRFINLLGAEADNVAEFLRPLNRLLAARGCALNYIFLLDDLTYWLDPNATERRDQIRQHWARHFYRASSVSRQAQQSTSPRSLMIEGQHEAIR
jgi:CRISPR system Cascade subunit CasB